MLRLFFLFSCYSLLFTGCIGNSKPIDSNSGFASMPGNESDTTTISSIGMSSSDSVSAPSASVNDPIPLKVYQVLQYIRVHHAPIPGFVGGTVFGNFQGILPKTDSADKKITYQEWDVNKHVQGVNRGVERLCTGSDNRAWYTHDHYATFTQVFDKKVRATENATESTTTLPNTSSNPNYDADKISKIVAYIKSNKAPMSGYKGGGIFENREKLLPATDERNNAVTYQMWDVNPISEHGNEKIITGSDGRVWFSNDRYKSFSPVKYDGSSTVIGSAPDKKPKPTVIPPKVYVVLKYVLANHAPMPDYVGGREFTNFQKVLPYADASGKKIFYQEWDVNKHVQGVNRGAERLCTGADGRNWYTADHYNTFVQVK